MKKENKFLAIVSALILIAFSAAYFLYRSSFISGADWTAFLIGALLAAFNFYAGVISLMYALKGSEKRFQIILFLGIFVRLFLMLSVVFLVLKFLQIRADVFIFVIFGFYSFFLITEIRYFYIVKGKTS